MTTAPHELSFALRMGMLLRPAAYVYEYFRYERGGKVDPGMMVTRAGVRHQPGFDAVSRMMGGLAAMRPVAPAPCYYYLSAPLCARTSELAGRVNRAVYFLARRLPCRMLPWRSYARVPAGVTVLLPPALEYAAPRAELASLLRLARARRWQLASTGETCAALARLDAERGRRAAGSGLSLSPLALGRMLARQYPGEEADDLEAALRRVPAFRRRLEEQPVVPREGVAWLQSGYNLYVWVEDREPVALQVDAARAGGVRRVWVSTRDGAPVQVLRMRAAGPAGRTRVPCREWRALSDL